MSYADDSPYRSPMDTFAASGRGRRTEPASSPRPNVHLFEVRSPEFTALEAVILNTTRHRGPFGLDGRNPFRLADRAGPVHAGRPRQAKAWATYGRPVSECQFYAGLTLYVVAEAVIFMALLYVASAHQCEHHPLGRRCHLGPERPC